MYVGERSVVYVHVCVCVCVGENAVFLAMSLNECYKEPGNHEGKN